MHMSRKGNDLVRSYLWNAARAAIVHNPVIAALYRRLKGKGKRGDVALGQCMRKLLHLVYVVWKTNQPFDDKHFGGETPRAVANVVAAPDGIETAVGHKRDMPAEEVVATADSTVAPTPPPVKPSTANRPARPKVDFAFLRQQVSMEQVLRHLGLFDQLHGRGQQRRGPCPIHGQLHDRQPTFSAHLGKHIFQCFHAACGAQGNVLDLWAAIHKLPLYQAALQLAETFQLSRNREEELVKGLR
jgi:CHC2 zinc finger